MAVMTGIDEHDAQEALRDRARRAVRAGLRVIPPKEDGTKRPETELVDGDWTWKHWMSAPPSREQLRAWYGPRHGVGIITGAASGDVTCFEFDDADVVGVFLDTAESVGLGGLVERIARGYSERTPGGGVHWLYRCPEVFGNRKLARRKREDGTIVPLIETRGEGGFAVLAPSWGRVHPSGLSYAQLAGGVETIAEITADEQRSLHQLAQAFNELPEDEFRPAAESSGAAGTGKPGADFNQRATWDEVLRPHGWTPVRTRGEVTFWRRPDKDRGVSATTNWQGSDLLYVFSTSTPFEAERGYSKWRAYAILEHAGDFSAAARQLAAEGYGEPATPTSIRLVRSGNRGVPPDAPGGPETHTEAQSGRRCYPLTDTGNAERLVARHGHDLRYVHLWGKWLAWDGRCWAIDETGEIERRAKATVRTIPAEAEGIAERDLYAATLKWAVGSESEARQRAMIRLAQAEEGIPTPPTLLDTDPWRMSLENGTLDLRTGQLAPHDRADLITRAVPVAWDPHATCPTFLAFLERITRDPDGAARPELVTFLQRAIGYSLTGLTSERVIFILYGTGRNGKSTLLDVIRGLLGDYAMRVPTETLMARRGESIPNDIARLKGARFVFANETDEGRRLSEALIKDITGGDTISARFMRGEWFDFKPEFKVWMATNHRPTIRGTDNAIWDRIRLIPFDQRIPDAEQDRDLGHRLAAELPGILAWAVEGCLAWQQGLRDGLGAPDAVRQATEAYRSSMDVLAAWLDDCCVVDKRVRGPAGALYESYKGWCETNGERHLPQRTFGQRLAERGFESVKGTGGKRFWNGITVAGESHQQAFDAREAGQQQPHASASMLQQQQSASGASGASGATFGVDDDEPTF